MADGWLGKGSQQEQVIMEFGSVETDDDLITVDLDHTFANPVVFVTMTTFNGNQVAVPRVTDVENDSFTFYTQEAEYLDGAHATETYSYFVVEQGAWTLSDGTKLEAGSKNTSSMYRSNWDSVSFETDFDSTPAIFTQIQSENVPIFASTRQDDSTANGFKFGLQEEEATNNTDYGYGGSGGIGGGIDYENFAWLAIEEGVGSDDGHDFQALRTGDSYTHEWKDIMFDDQLDELPQLLASISTTDGGDSSYVRADNLSANKVSVQVQEDQSKDDEINHTSEVFDVFAIEGFGQLTGTGTEII